MHTHKGHVESAIRCAETEASRLADPLVNEKCDICGGSLRLRTRVTSYAGIGMQKMCYDCVGRMDAQSMIAGFPIVLYLTEHKSPVPGDWVNHSAINYCGTISFKIFWITKSVHRIRNRHTGRADVRFIGPDGAEWSGRNIGPNQILRCRRNKRQQKILTPLQESHYFKPYPYETSQTR